MPIRLTFLASIVCVLRLVTPRSALAQAPIDSAGWLLSPMLGLALDEDADPSLTVAAALGYSFTNAIAVEGELGHVFDMAPGDSDVDSSLTTVHGSLLYFLGTDDVVHPYVAAGLGVSKFSHEVERPPASIESTELGFNLGAGLTYALNNRAWLRGDFRFFNPIDDTPSVWRVVGAVTLRIGS